MARKFQSRTYSISLIGSRSKRMQFERWFAGQGGDTDLLGRLVMPIGGMVKDKRPAVIAATVAAQLVEHLLGEDIGEGKPGLPRQIAGGRS